MKSLAGLLLGVPICPDFQFKETESVTELLRAWRTLPLMMSLNVLLGVGSMAWAGLD